MVVDINLNNKSFDESFYIINNSVQEAFHNFEMNILLSKYNFLQENGVILEEAEESKKQNFIQKCKQFITNFVETLKRKVKELKQKAADKVKEIKEKIKQKKFDKELQEVFDKADSDLNKYETEVYDDFSTWVTVENAKLDKMLNNNDRFIEADFTVQEVVETNKAKEAWNKFANNMKSKVNEVKKKSETSSNSNEKSLVPA